jgi:hypothetical protein
MTFSNISFASFASSSHTECPVFSIDATVGSARSSVSEIVTNNEVRVAAAVSSSLSRASFAWRRELGWTKVGLEERGSSVVDAASSSNSFASFCSLSYTPPCAPRFRLCETRILPTSPCYLCCPVLQALQRMMIENHEGGVRNDQSGVYRTWRHAHPCLRTLNIEWASALHGLRMRTHRDEESCAECRYAAGRSVLAGSVRAISESSEPPSLFPLCYPCFIPITILDIQAQDISSTSKSAPS